jgi:hypothetical protein
MRPALKREFWSVTVRGVLLSGFGLCQIDSLKKSNLSPDEIQIAQAIELPNTAGDSLKESNLGRQ